ncbi:gamma-glutamylcyclotransferase family protein [Streptomyces rubiginosohelvolus]|uniref:gamma-glutamylcyclotransferase family protein n=1 Tax=Streptomyces rubiginosohelvolus TaxID=67362 RepID=UPI0036B69C70
MTQAITTAPPEATQHRNRLSQRPDVLFCYGTLQFDAVLRALLGRVPSKSPAAARGYRAAALEGRVYPGLVAGTPADVASGLALTDLSGEEWRILDAFEDVLYELRQLPLSDGRRGWAYVWPGGEVRRDDWDAAAFEDHHLASYSARCARLAPGLAAGRPKGSY